MVKIISINFSSFYGYDYLALIGDSFVKADATVDYEILKKHHFNVSANFANIGEDIFLNSEWFQPPSYGGYSVGYGYETIFGPIEVKYNWSEQTKKTGFFCKRRLLVLMELMTISNAVFFLE